MERRWVLTKLTGLLLAKLLLFGAIYIAEDSPKVLNSLSRLQNKLKAHSDRIQEYAFNKKLLGVPR